VSLTPSALLARARAPGAKKVIRYSMVSVMAVAVSQLVLAIAFGVLEWKARAANLLAVSISAGPSYLLNRYWVWGKRGRNHFLKEVAPFWGMALLGLLFSTFTVGLGEDFADRTTDNALYRTAIVNASSLFAFGLLWVGKFVVLNKVLFASHAEDLEDAPALDGRSGIPT
jgi:putative flippase GtrA